MTLETILEPAIAPLWRLPRALEPLSLHITSYRLACSEPERKSGDDECQKDKECDSQEHLSGVDRSRLGESFE